MSAQIPNLLIWLIFVIVVIIVLVVVLKLLIGVLYIAPIGIENIGYTSPYLLN